MKEKKKPNKALIAIGLIFAIALMGLGGFVLHQMFKHAMEWSVVFSAVMLVFLGLFILLKCISSLTGKPLKKGIGYFPIVAAVIFASLGSIAMGIEGGSVFFTFAGFFVLFAMFVVIGLFISNKRNQAKSGEDAKEIYEQKKNDKAILVFAVAFVIILILSVALTTSGGGKEGVCQYCDRVYTDSSNKRSISRTNMCENCYGNYKSLTPLLDD